MHPIEVVTLLLGVTTLLTVVARKINIPYPILLVLVGLAVGWIPGLPTVVLTPDAVFLIFLPPLLYAAAWNLSWRDLWRARRPVTLLAIGLVAFTSSIIAWLSSAIIPTFTLAMGFLLGGIISPPDAVAATSVMKDLNVPKRVTIILEGESLVNDATSLVIFQYALVAITTGQFVLWRAGFQFVWMALGSIGIGLGLGWGLLFLHRLIRTDALVNTAVTLLTPYLAYLLAEAFHLSGVLAVVSAGLFVSWRSSEVFSHATRLQAVSVWETMTFLLNGLIFILIGLQLPSIVSGMSNYWLPQAIKYTLLISLAVILIRIVWVYPGTYLPRLLNRHIRETEPRPSWQSVAVVSWAGMRGVVSLAAALSIPNTLPNGEPFPGRNMILFITFGVILCTLVAQGLTLPVLVRLLRVQEPPGDGNAERKIRLDLARSVIEHLEANYSLGSVTETVLYYVKNGYEERINQLSNRFRTTTAGENPVVLFEEARELQRNLLKVERERLMVFRKDGSVSDEILRKIERELDLDSARLLG